MFTLLAKGMLYSSFCLIWQVKGAPPAPSTAPAATTKAPATSAAPAASSAAPATTAAPPATTASPAAVLPPLLAGPGEKIQDLGQGLTAATTAIANQLG